MYSIPYCSKVLLYLVGDDENDFGFSTAAEIHRKTVANGFWNYELELELRDRDMENFLFARTNDREKAMSLIDEQRADSIYDHDTCSDECKHRGMYKATALDNVISHHSCTYIKICQRTTVHLKCFHC